MWLIYLDKIRYFCEHGRPQCRHRQGLPLRIGSPVIPDTVFAEALATKQVALPIDFGRDIVPKLPASPVRALFRLSFCLLTPAKILVAPRAGFQRRTKPQIGWVPRDQTILLGR